MSADLAHTPQAAQAAATARAKQVADGIRANGIKQGYANRDAEWHKALGVTSMDEAREVTGLRKRPTQQEELKHGRHRFYQGMVLGGVIGGALIAITASLLLREAFHQAGQYGREMVVTGAISQSVNEPTACLPGSTLPDGRVCPNRN